MHGVVDDGDFVSDRVLADRTEVKLLLHREDIGVAHAVESEIKRVKCRRVVVEDFKRVGTAIDWRSSLDES